MTTKTPTSKPSFTPTSGEKLLSKLSAFYAASDTHVERVKLFSFDCLSVDTNHAAP